MTTGENSATMNFELILLSATVLAVVSSASVPHGASANDLKTGGAYQNHDDHVSKEPDDHGDDKGLDFSFENDGDQSIDGIPLKYLTEDELDKLLDEDDNILMSELDIVVGREEVMNQQKSKSREWVPWARRVLFTAGRALFETSKAGRFTANGKQVTRQYSRNGNYQEAVQDFSRLRPGHQKTFASGAISGRVGTVGVHRVIVYDGSINGSPTLEIRSPRNNGGEKIRVFRYYNN